MAENSKIEWTDHTFNPWMGCTKVSDGCKFCYAMTMMDHRYGKVKWGPQGVRVRTAKAYWKQPLKWNKEIWRECLDCGFRGKVGPDQPFYLCRCGSRNNKPTRQRVFCASLADVFEHKQDQLEEMNQWRADLFAMIEQTPNLDWLLLTKRPENVPGMMMACGLDEVPGNVWIGTSIENQAMADERIPALVRIPAKIHFLSVEPMLEKIDLDLRGKHYGIDYPTYSEDVSWVICGGESGPDARPMNPEWARSLRDQCKEAGVPFFFKQWGEWAPRSHVQVFGLNGKEKTFRKKPVPFGDEMMLPVGKHWSGSVLDGQEIMEFPK